MDIKDYAQMMGYLTRPRDVIPDPSSMVPGPRNMAEGGRMGFNKGLSAKQKKALTITYPKDATKDLDFKKTGEYPVNISKEGNSFRVKLLNGKRKSVKDLDAAIELLKSDGQTVKYLGADQKQVLDWIKSQTETITTDDIAKYISNNDLSVTRNKITSIIKDNPEYEGKVKLVKEYKANFLNKDGTIKQGTVDEITNMINNPEDFPTMQAMAKKLNYKGTIKNVINQWSAQTGNDIPFERFRVHTYRDTEIAEKIIKAFDAQGDNPNIAKLARQFQNEMPGVNSFNSAKVQIRRILVDHADYEPRPNAPKSANEMSYYKKRRQNISLALKRMGDTSIKGQMDEMLYNKNQEYVKLANENPDKILNNKKLRFALENTVDVDTGEFKIRNDGKGLSDNEILERVKRGDLFTEDHITEVRTAETAPKKSGEGIKLTKGVNIEYPTNKQAVTINFNQSFLPNAQKYLTENPNGKNVQKIVNVLKDYGLQIKAGDKTYGTTEKVAWDNKTKTSPRYNSNFNIFDSSARNIGEIVLQARKKQPGGFIATDLVKDVGRLTAKGAKKTGSAFKKVGGPLEGLIGGVDFLNNLESMDADEAFKTSLSDFTFGMYKGKKREQMETLNDAAVEMGYENKGFNELKEIMDLEQLLKREKSEVAKMESALLDYPDEDAMGVSAYDQDFSVNERENLKNRKDFLDRLKKEIKSKSNALLSLGDVDSLVENYIQTVDYVGRKQYNKNKYRKDQVYPDMNPFGSALWSGLTDWGTLGTKDKKIFALPHYVLPQNLMEHGFGIPAIKSVTQPVVRTLRKLPGVLGDMWDPSSDLAKLSAMSDEEKRKRAEYMNIRNQNYHPVTGTTMRADQMEQYYDRYFPKKQGGRVGYSEGGITGLRSKYEYKK